MIHELKIEVGDHPISLEIEGDSFLHPIREVYQRFLSDKDPECRVRIYPDGNLTVQDESSVGLTFSNGGFRIVEDYLIGSVDLTRNEGELRINWNTKKGDEPWLKTFY